MTTNIARLHTVILNICPIESVNTERVIAFKPEATDQQRQAAQEIADAWDFDAPEPRDVKAEIAQMERDSLMPRAVREFMLAFMEANFTMQQLAGNPGYQKMKAFDSQIKALREFL
ncbi:MAG: hypothetical protein LC131_02135 [Anaerolineae bacterium]|nr:hypothetical protein [Anaerolineae bacterium]